MRIPLPYKVKSGLWSIDSTNVIFESWKKEGEKEFTGIPVFFENLYWTPGIEKFAISKCRKSKSILWKGNKWKNSRAVWKKGRMKKRRKMWTLEARVPENIRPGLRDSFTRSLVAAYMALCKLVNWVWIGSWKHEDLLPTTRHLYKANNNI